MWGGRSSPLSFLYHKLPAGLAARYSVSLMKKNEQMRFSDRKRMELDFQWPDVPLNIVLVSPSIPPHTGNIARLCAATGSRLHLIEPLH